MKIIILAAGQGSRMGVISKEIPKPLMPIGDSNVICRLIFQLLERNKNDINIVVGYKSNLIKETITKAFPNADINFIQNNAYKTDTNIYSVYLATKELQSTSFIIFESDCIYSDSEIEKICLSMDSPHSYWYTIGNFLENQVGGILKSDYELNVIDVDVVKKFESKYKEYKKLIGILKVHKSECQAFTKLICDYQKQNTRQYYLQPWIENLKELPSKELPLDPNGASAFNNLMDYNSIIN